MRIRRLTAMVLGAFGLLAPAGASANTVVLDFDGIVGLPFVLLHAISDYYDAGFSSGRFGDPPAGPGPDYGVVFNDGGHAFIQPDAVSGDSVLLINFGFSSPPISMDVESGFTELSFLYRGAAITLAVYDDFAGSGNRLGDVDLPSAEEWTLASVPFSGVAHSLLWDDDFPIGTLFEDLTMNLVPEPATTLLLGSGVIALAAGRAGSRRPQRGDG